jgi:hypothetical protein
MNDVAFRPHAIQSGMERMLAAAALPMLSDVQIRVQVRQHIMSYHVLHRTQCCIQLSVLLLTKPLMQLVSGTSTALSQHRLPPYTGSGL